MAEVPTTRERRTSITKSPSTGSTTTIAALEEFLSNDEQQALLRQAYRKKKLQQLQQSGDVDASAVEELDQQYQYYIKWRKALLRKKLADGKMDFEGMQDRRKNYQNQRTKILEDKRKKKRSVDLKAGLEYIPGASIVINKSKQALDLAAKAFVASDDHVAQQKKIVGRSRSIENQLNEQGNIEGGRRNSFSNARSNGGNEEPAATLPRRSSSPKPPSIRVLPIVSENSSRVADAYSFAGMHHIFTEHSQPVTIVKFANDERGLLSFASRDGKISICDIFADPPQLIRTLQGHLEAVTEFRWSMTNDIIISTSEDKTVRVWQVKNGECIRTITDKAVCTTCLFHPINNNIFIYGTANGWIYFINFSTGKCFQKANLASLQRLAVPLQKATNTTLGVTAAAFTDAGDLLFVGDSKGYIHTFKFDVRTGVCQLIGKTLVSASSRSVVSIEFKGWYSNQERTPSLLVGCCDSTVKIFKVDAKPSPISQMSLESQFPVVCMTEAIRSHFCPLLSNRDGMCIVTGSEDTTVHIFDVTKQKADVNHLQGHSSIVYDVAWNYDESILASCDATGTVICWKRTKELTTRSD